MPDDPDLIGQSEIEDLLNQAKSAGVAPSDAAGDGAMQQNEIDSLLGGTDGAASSVGAPPGPPLASSPAAASVSDMPAAHPAPSGTETADDVQFLLDQAEQALASAGDSGASNPDLSPFQFKDLTGTPPSAEKATLDLLRDVELDLKIELGRTYMELEEVLKLRKGSVVTLDKLAGDPVDVFVNGRLVARGEILVLNDNFCVRVAELVSGND